METKWFTNGPIDLEVKVQGEGPLILMRSWLARTLVLVAASDELFRLSWVQGGSNECARGYGGSSHPSDVESYTIKISHLTWRRSRWAFPRLCHPVWSRLGRSNRLPISHTLSGSILRGGRPKCSLSSDVRTIVSRCMERAVYG